MDEFYFQLSVIITHLFALLFAFAGGSKSKLRVKNYPIHRDVKRASVFFYLELFR